MFGGLDTLQLRFSKLVIHVLGPLLSIPQVYRRIDRLVIGAMTYDHNVIG